MRYLHVFYVQNMSFAVVGFTDEDTVEIVCAGWLVHGNQVQSILNFISNLVSCSIICFYSVYCCIHANSFEDCVIITASTFNTLITYKNIYFRLYNVIGHKV